MKIAAEPSPGRVEPPDTRRASAQLAAVAGAVSAAEEATPPPLASPPPQRLDDGGANHAAWIALIALALGALGGVAAFRVRELLRDA